jgi:hypothetical protein
MEKRSMKQPPSTRTTICNGWQSGAAAAAAQLQQIQQQSKQKANMWAHSRPLCRQHATGIPQYKHTQDCIQVLRHAKKENMRQCRMTPSFSHSNAVCAFRTFRRLACNRGHPRLLLRRHLHTQHATGVLQQTHTQHCIHVLRHCA